MDWIDPAFNWIKDVFDFLFDAVKASLNFVIDKFEAFLLWLPWLVLVVGTFLLSVGLAGMRVAIFSVVGFSFMGLVGMWDQTLSTLALMAVTVAVIVVVAIPIGILASRSDAFEAAIRPLLDTMQTMPFFAYLIPAVFLFGLGGAATVAATMVYALPPGIRLTNLGIRQVSRETIEVARSFGSTSLQTLMKVQLPLALPSIMMGINQVIMMALSSVVLASLIGAGGLGQEVRRGLARFEMGQALEGGLGILFLAIIFDRLSQGLIKKDSHSVIQQERRFILLEIYNSVSQTIADGLAMGLAFIIKVINKRDTTATVQPFFRRHAFFFTSIVVLLILLGIHLYIKDFGEFPWHLSFKEHVNGFVLWVSRTFGGITDFLSYTIRDYLLDPVDNLLQGISPWPPFLDFLPWPGLPWPVIVVVVGALARLMAGWRVGLFAVLGLLFMGFQGEAAKAGFNMWEVTMTTLAQVIVATFLAVLIAIPLGTLAALSDFFERIIRPVLDAMQTIPIFIYLIPVVMLFGVGLVSGIIATVVYSIPPAVRLTNLGIREVSPEVIEAARSMGSTPLQVLYKIQFPLAMPSIMMGINQTIMMVLAMVIIAALVGVTGLGEEILFAKTRVEIGTGLGAGLGIVFMAMLMDRMIQGWAQKRETALKLIQ
ncbi:MAG: ABC transporter permease subunit [Dehalococcoidia bacterium]